MPSRLKPSGTVGPITSRSSVRPGPGGKTELTIVFGVGTGPDYRLQGVATALMNDAIAEADVREHALLLLSGIPNFYHRFGYIDVVELTEQVIERTAVPVEAPEDVAIRRATTADVAALLAIYRIAVSGRRHRSW